ncbi:hypothetical protein [Hymenobacter sp. HDW8]|uniref:hypothetical protein n=1 Tax=Hymenobacter sp. HDW8 TaxID=2714932 RepID=UPI001407E557|nr:hypothetical protein [Hymenobacter sp. HDW8]QIL76141.1 hypothetical protein G7064_09940 [Hymenobacter sp. HDW8]
MADEVQSFGLLNHYSAIHMVPCLFFLLFSLFGWQIPADNRLSEEARQVQAAYKRFKKEPASLQVQQRFVVAFPASQAAFIRVFHPADFGQLYASSDKYIQTLQQVGSNYPKEVLHKCLIISKDLVWDADATGFLQHATARMGAAHPRIFMQEARQLSLVEQTKLFRFLADVENHNQYPEYQLLMKQLSEIGATDLTQMMRQAKEQRVKQKGH